MVPETDGAASDVPQNEFWVRASGVFAANFKLGPEMKRYQVLWRMADVTEKKRARLRGRRHLGYFRFGNPGKGKVWLDAVQLEKGEQVHPYVSDGYRAPRH